MARPSADLHAWAPRLTSILLALSAGACASLIGLDDYERIDGPAPTSGSGGAACEPGATEACYSGPFGTEGQGVCQGGTRTCDDAGQWGPCEGEVVPAAEVCATAVDDDCDGQVNEGGADCSCVPGSVADCYTGPAATRGVGLCSDGQQTCDDDGNGYGPCTGEVLPAAEVCGSDVDEDCDGEVWFPDPDCVCEPGSTGPCYTGPMGTENVGVCHGGTWTCNADGLGWDGMCVGEVVPFIEDCGTPEDDDCDDEGGWFITGEFFECLCQPGEMQACYTGPIGSENVGACHGGTWTCNPDGLSYGPCIGEVMPAAMETCGNAVLDETCDGVTCGGDVVWAIDAGGSGIQDAWDVAVDGAGNVLVAGRFLGTLSLGGTTLTSDTSGSGYDGFLLKLDAAGAPLWIKQLGGTGTQFARSVAVDSLGNAYVTGYFADTMSIDGVMTTLSTDGVADVDLFVAKFAPAGGLVWAADHGTGTSAGGGNDQVALGITVNGNDNVAITGYFQGHVVFTDPGGMVQTRTTTGGDDLFVAGLGANGAMRWFSGFGDSANQTGRKVALGSAAYVIGDGVGSFSIGAESFVLGSNTDILALGLNGTTGAPTWADNFAPTPDTNVHGLDIALVPGGDLLLAGYYENSLNLGGGALPSTAPGRFVTRRSSTGAHVWSRGFAAPTSAPTTSEVPLGVAADAAGNVLLAGEHSGTANFGGSPLTSAGAGDFFVVKLDPAGNHVWSRRFGNAQQQDAYAVAADPTGHAVVTGNFLGTVNFGITSLTANSSGAGQTLFVAKLAP